MSDVYETNRNSWVYFSVSIRLGQRLLSCGLFEDMCMRSRDRWVSGWVQGWIYICESLWVSIYLQQRLLYRGCKVAISLRGVGVKAYSTDDRVSK